MHTETYVHTRACPHTCTHPDMCTHPQAYVRTHTAHPQTHVHTSACSCPHGCRRTHGTVPSGSHFVTLLDFSRGSCWPASPRGCTFPWDTVGHLGESLAKTGGEARQPLLRNLLKDRATRALGGALGRGRGWSAQAPLVSASASEGPWWPSDPLAAPFCSEPRLLSKATLMGEGQTVLLGRLMKRLGEGKGLLGERQEGEKGLEGEGGTQVPVYTARWGLGARCWPGCREGKRAE